MMPLLTLITLAITSYIINSLRTENTFLDAIGLKFPVQTGRLCAFKFTIPYNVSCDLHGSAHGVIDMALLAWTSSISASMQAPEKSRHRM